MLKKNLFMCIIISSNLLQDNRKEKSPIQFDSDALARDTSADPFDLCGDITGHRANQRNEELTVALQQLAGHTSESSTSEEEEEEDEEEEVEEEEELDEVVEEEAGRDCSDVGMGGESQESQDRVEEDEQSWGMETDERRAVDEEEDEEALKDRLCRLVAHARLTYFTSTDDELDKAGLSEGECEEGKDEGWREDRTVPLSYKICQLEKEVGVSQFSSTEDELDRVGGEEEDGGGEEEELAVKVCKLAHQVNATHFSSTEEELDGAGGGEETEEGEEESLWTFQKENAARAAHLSSLVRTSRFSSAEDQQGDENDGGEVRGQPGRNWERRESLGDLDVKMFDLRDEIESSGEKETRGNSLDSQRRDEKEGEEEKSDRGEPEDGKQMETEPLTEESLETREGGGEMREESDVEDEEFDRMINSMLTMTLEDMQGGGVDEEAPENEKANRELEEKMKEGRESTFEGARAEAGVTETSEITDGAEENEPERGEAIRSGREDAAGVTVKEDDQDGTEGRLEENEGTDKRAEESKEENEAVVEDSATSVPEGPLTAQEVQTVRHRTSLCECIADLRSRL